jgi:excisionase family DNA binding protein
MARPLKLTAAKPKPKSHHSPVERKALSIPEFAKAYGVKRVTVFRTLKAGRLKAVRIGAHRLVLLDSVQQADDAQ